jgi:hypothetical protein
LLTARSRLRIASAMLVFCSAPCAARAVLQRRPDLRAHDTIPHATTLVLRIRFTADFVFATP